MIQNQSYELTPSEQSGVLSDELGAMTVRNSQDVLLKLWVGVKMLNMRGC